MSQLYAISEHAAQRIAERFGVTSEAEQVLWAMRQMRQARQCICQLGRAYTYKPRIAWVTDGVVIVTDGPEVVTAYRVTSMQRDCLLYGLDEEGAA